jgi:hypothetical protein
MQMWKQNNKIILAENFLSNIQREDFSAMKPLKLLLKL